MHGFMQTSFYFGYMSYMSYCFLLVRNLNRGFPSTLCCKSIISLSLSLALCVCVCGCGWVCVCVCRL